jgi:hypothetical protein
MLGAVDDYPVAFLRGRLDEDERRAQAMGHFTVHEQPYYSCPATRTEAGAGDLEWGEDACDCFLAGRKARALREVEAKRAILAEFTRALAAQNEMLASPAGDQSVTYEWENGRVCALLNALRGFAAIYQDHPDYRPAP